MSKIKIISLTVVAVAGVAALASKIQFEGSTEALYERFPYVDRKIVREVHKEMVRETLAGEYSGLDLDNDEICDEIFLAKVMLRTHS